MKLIEIVIKWLYVFKNEEEYKKQIKWLYVLENEEEHKKHNSVSFQESHQ